MENPLFNSRADMAMQRNVDPDRLPQWSDPPDDKLGPGCWLFIAAILLVILAIVWFFLGMPS